MKLCLLSCLESCMGGLNSGQTQEVWPYVLVSTFSFLLKCSTVHAFRFSIQTLLTTHCG